jgi:hypothetical protein
VGGRQHIATGQLQHIAEQQVGGAVEHQPKRAFLVGVAADQHHAALKIWVAQERLGNKQAAVSKLGHNFKYQVPQNKKRGLIRRTIIRKLSWGQNFIVTQ